MWPFHSKNTDSLLGLVNEHVPSFLQSSSPVNHAYRAGIGDDFTAETASPASMWPMPTAVGNNVSWTKGSKSAAGGFTCCVPVY